MALAIILAFFVGLIVGAAAVMTAGFFAVKRLTLAAITGE